MKRLGDRWGAELPDESYPDTRHFPADPRVGIDPPRMPYDAGIPKEVLIAGAVLLALLFVK